MLLIAAISLYALANSNKDFFLYVNGVDARTRLANTLNDAAAQRAIALRNIAPGYPHRLLWVGFSRSWKAGFGQKRTYSVQDTVPMLLTSQTATYELDPLPWV